MGKYDGYLICSDFDGTLAKETRISDENRAAINEFIAGGGLFTIASGRSPEFLIAHTADIGINAPLMGINGGAIADPLSGKMLHSVTLDEGALTALCALTQMISTISFIEIVYCEDRFLTRRLTRGGDLEPKEILAYTGKDIYKILIVFEQPEHAYAAEQTCRILFGSRYLFERSWPYGLEMLPREGGKGNGILALKEILGDKVKCVIGAGDYENDISLIKAADIGFAVSNAIDPVKETADRVTKNDCTNAVAEIIRSLPEL